LKKKRIKKGCIERGQLDLFYDFLDIQKDMQEQAQELSVNPICNTSLQHDKEPIEEKPDGWSFPSIARV